MPTKKPALLQLLELPVVSDSHERLSRHYDVLLANKQALLEQFIAQRAGDIQVVVTSAMTPTSGALIERLPALKAICNVGVGYDSIDVDAAAKRGIQVSNTPGVLDDCVADMAWGLIIATLRGMGSAERYVRAGLWQSQMPALPLGRRVSGKKLGIVGLGRIGQAIARRATGFSMQLRYHNRTPRPDVPYPYEASLLQLAAWADILLVATVGGASTRHLIDSQVLDALGPEGVLINIARGSVVDQQALIKALQENTIAGAGLDVFENEPEVPEELKVLENVVLQPHIASASLETRQDMVNLTLANVDSFAVTGRLLTPVPETASQQ